MDTNTTILPTREEEAIRRSHALFYLFVVRETKRPVEELHVIMVIDPPTTSPGKWIALLTEAKSDIEWEGHGDSLAGAINALFEVALSETRPP